MIDLDKDFMVIYFYGYLSETELRNPLDTKSDRWFGQLCSCHAIIMMFSESELYGMYRIQCFHSIQLVFSF